MKRPAAFVLVFGAGALALWWADRVSRERRVRAAEERPSYESLPDAPPEVARAAQDDDQDPPARVVIRGQAKLNVFPLGLGPQTRTHELEGFFVPEDEYGRRYLVRDLTTRVFDPDGALIETIEAARARFGLRFEGRREGTFARVEVAEQGKVALEEVTITRHSGHPLAPLVFQAPALDAYLTADRLQSIGDTQVTVRGQGLEAEGQGLNYVGSTGFLGLDAGGELRLEREAQAPLRFRTPTGGPLEVVRVGPPEEQRLELRARDGAELISRGEPFTRVDARTIDLLGRVAGGQVVLEHGTAADEVVALRGAERYSGQSASLDFDDAGRVTRTVLDQRPEARVPIEDEGGRQTFLVARGAGPLTAWLAEQRQQRFLLIGPGTAEVEGGDLRVEAEGRIEGAAAADLSSATLLAREGVRVFQGETRLDTESLDALFLAGTQRSVDLYCVGTTRLTGRDERGALLTVDIEHEADVRVRGRSWTVPLARGVVMHTLGDDPLRATAGVVRDLDPLAMRAVLEQGVSWVGVFGEADASRAQLRGRRSAVLFGQPGSPARFRVLPQRGDLPAAPEVELATFSALMIDVSPGHLVARDAVRVHLEETGRTWSLEASRTELTAEEPAEPGAPRPFSFTARDVTRAELVEGDTTTSLRCVDLVAGGWLHESAGATARVEVTWVVASGGVEFARFGPQEVHARGARLAYQGGAARLTADPGDQVQVWGPDGHGAASWRFDADALVYDGERLGAQFPKVRIEAPLLPGELRPGFEPVPATIEADRIWLEQDALVFEGHVLAQGADGEGIPVRLSAGHLRLVGAAGEGGFSLDQIESFEASDGFVAVYGGLALARGARLSATRDRLVLKGDESRDALLDLRGIGLRSSLLDLDLVRFLVTSERGELFTSAEYGGWTVGYAALQPFEENGETLMAMVAPRFEAPGEQHARADFGALWLHAEVWAARGRRLLFGTPRALDETPVEPPVAPVAAREGGLVHNVFSDLLAGDLSRYVKAAHIEGNLEVTDQGRTAARASEAYLDLELRSGWLKDASLVARMDISGAELQQRMRVRAGEIVTAADGSLRAENATLTTSTHEVPGYVIRTGRLVLAPREDGTWSFSARPNRIRFKSGISLPLPPLGSIVLDDQGGFVGIEDSSGNLRTIEGLSIGNTARMGTEIGGAVRYPIGRLGRRLGEFFGFNDTRVQGDWASEASYLSTRGILIGTGLELRERKPSRGRDTSYWFNMYAKGISDSGEDLGLVRVRRDDRDSLRTWIYGRGRYPFSRTSWIEASISSQSDPGVQAEFFEAEYERYEERENDVHWRSADGATYASARVKARMNDFRSEVEELPSIGLYGGETPIGRVAGAPLLWRRSFDLAYLRRREGDPAFEDPFSDSLGVPDGLGEQEVLRATTEQRLSAPFKTGLGGIVATPWLGTELTAWDEGALSSGDSPTRAALIGGLDLATVLHKRTEDGFLHTLSPTLHLRGDLAVEQDGAPLVRFDALEDPVEGEQAGIGLRALWLHPTDRRQLDLALRVLQHRDRGGLPDQDRVELLGVYRTEVWGRPFAALSDTRLDPAGSGTIYGRSTIAIAPSEVWLLQLSHVRGRGIDGVGLFESASFDTRWTLDPKWELQLGQDINMLASGTLRSQIVLRRFGADFMFELEIENRAGEGGTSVTVNFAPMFLWKRRPLGILER